MTLGSINRKLREWLFGPPPELSRELREASHKLANESMALQCEVNRLKRSPDPFRELERALSGRDERDGSRH